MHPSIYAMPGDVTEIISGKCHIKDLVSFDEGTALNFPEL
jgi:hypothetical protein